MCFYCTHGCVCYNIYQKTAAWTRSNQRPQTLETPVLVLNLNVTLNPVLEANTRNRNRAKQMIIQKTTTTTHSFVGVLRKVSDSIRANRCEIVASPLSESHLCAQYPLLTCIIHIGARRISSKLSHVYESITSDAFMFTLPSPIWHFLDMMNH